MTGVTYQLQGSTLVARCAGSADLTACWHPGTFVTLASGSNNWQPVLPAGVSAATVQGLRVTAQRADGGNWERPANPTVSLVFKADRRQFLRYSPDGPDTPVPSTRPDLDPAPGETARGTFTDTVDVHVDGGWNDQADPWVADASATATTKLTHLQNKIKVTKAPGNGSNAPPAYAPGAQIPYVMTFTNTGSWPMTGLSIVDHIATNENGSLLVEPRDADGDPAPSYVFTLKNGSGANLPVTGITAHLNPTTGNLRISLPDGFVLHPGDVLTLTAKLVYQAGLAPGTAVENNVVATSDRIFDQCQHTHNNQSAPNQSNVGSCAADTVTEPSAASPIRSVKSVKGSGAGVPGASPSDPNYDDLGVIQLGFGSSAGQCTAPNAANGFYRYPCVPITRAGGTETWQLSMTNEGNVPAGVLAGIDVLPRPGDTGVTIDSARDSRWAATLIGNFTDNAGGLGGGAHSFATYYSTAVPSTQCNSADILNETTPGGIPPSNPCYADVHARTWIPVAGATPAQLATAKALKSVLTYPGAASGDGLAPGRTLHVTFDTTTAAYPAVAELKDRDAIAWNSFAVGAQSRFNGSTQVTSVVEPRKVGVALSTGRVDLEKVVVAPPGSSYPLPSSYTFTLACTSNGTDVTVVDTTGAAVNPVVLKPGQVVHVNDGDPANPWGEVNLPRYASCHLTEAGAQGADVTFDPAGPTAGTSGDVTAVRDYSSRHDIANPAYPDPIPVAQITATNTYSAAGFTVSKEVDAGGAVDQGGHPIAYTDTFDFTASCTFNGTEVVPAADRAFTLGDGDEKVFGDLPAGSACTVTETDSAGSASTTHVVTEDGSTGPPTAGKTATFTLGADSGSTHVNAVAYTNHYTTGPVTITKAVIGPGADPWGVHTFTLHLECTLANADPTTVYSADHVIDKADPVWEVTDLPTGATCQVTETATGGASFTFTDPVDGKVAVGDSTPVTIDVVNVFQLGSIEVTKHLAGDVDENPAIATGTYTVSLGCTVEVNGDTYVVPIPGGAVRELHGDGDSVVYTGLPTGAACTVDEVSSDPPAQEVSISPVGPYTVGPSENTPVQVGVTNTYHLGSVRVTKDVTGPGAALYGAGPFDVHLACTVDVGGTPTPVTINGGADRTLSSATSLTTEYHQLPVGAECTLTETDDGDADSTAMIVDTGGSSSTSDGRTATFTIVDDTASAGDGSGPGVVVTARNRFDLGAIAVTKTVSGPGADRYGAGPFHVHLACTRISNGDTVDVDIPGGADRELDEGNGLSTVYDDLPPGAACTLTETDAAGANGTSLTITTADGAEVTTGTTSAEFVVGNDTADGGSGPGLEAALDNRFDVGSLEVVKRVVGAGADRYGAGPFTVALACTSDATGSVVDVDVPGGAERVLSQGNGYRTTYEELPPGAQCTLTETGTGHADSTSIAVTADGSTTHTDGTEAAVVIGEGDATEAVVTNTFLAGGIAVVKQVAGAGASTGARYVVSLSCTRLLDGEFTAVAVPDGARRTLSAGTSMRAEWSPLPVGATCTVSEVRDGGAYRTTIEPGKVTVGAGEVTTVTVVNVFRPTGLGPNHAITGGPGGPGGLPNTGSDVPPWLPWAALAAVLAGAALVVASRRRG